MDTLIQSAIQGKHYSFQWAEGVVKRWAQQHPRVSEELWKFPYFSINSLADLLISEPKTWYYLKSYVKKTEDILRAPGNSAKTTTQALSDALKFFQNHHNETGFVTLTACLEWAILWEPIE